MRGLLARRVLAAVFGVAAAAKLADRDGTARMLGELGMRHRLRPGLALALPGGGARGSPWA